MSLIISISTVMEYLYCPRNAWYAFVGERRNMSNSDDFIKAVHTHKAVDENSVRFRPHGKQMTGVYLHSHSLGLAGRADIVEWHENIPIPVETKTGKVRDFLNFRVQLCLQAFCLEEMFNVQIPHGYVFFSEARRRNQVNFDNELRKHCIADVAVLRKSFLANNINRFKRVDDNRCFKCQYRESCLPPKLDMQTGDIL